MTRNVRLLRRGGRKTRPWATRQECLVRIFFVVSISSSQSQSSNPIGTAQSGKTISQLASYELRLRQVLLTRCLQDDKGLAAEAANPLIVLVGRA